MNAVAIRVTAATTAIVFVLAQALVYNAGISWEPDGVMSNSKDRTGCAAYRMTDAAAPVGLSSRAIRASCL